MVRVTRRHLAAILSLTLLTQLTSGVMADPRAAPPRIINDVNTAPAARQEVEASAKAGVLPSAESVAEIIAAALFARDCRRCLQPPGLGLHFSNSQNCKPRPDDGPITQACLDINPFVSMIGFVIDIQAPNVSGWGYLAAQPEPQPAAGAAEDALLKLENQQVILGLLPDVGGTIVLLRTPDGPNLLKADPKYWSLPPPAVSVAKPEFVPYNGHTCWLGPQKDWWTQQELNPNLKKRAATWPPDPFLTMGKYEVVEKTATAIKLKSAASPVSGVQLLKEIRLEGNQVHLKTTATNIRDREVSWDLWSNTRLPGDARVFVPVGKRGSSIRLAYNSWDIDKQRVLPYDVTDGFLNYDRELADADHIFVSKTFITPSQPFIAAFTGDCLFIKQAPPVPKNQLHPDQAFIEIYKFVGDTADPLTELEMHSAYQTLKPGAQLSFEETWSLIPCVPLPDTAARVKFLREHLPEEIK